MKPALTHLALGVASPEATVAFYRKHAGLHVVHERVDDGTHVVWLSERPEHPRFVLVLLPTHRHASPTTLLHLGFAVASRAEVDAIAAAGHADGVLAAAPADGGPIVGYFCLLRDPDGNLVEFSHGQPIDPHELPP